MRFGALDVPKSNKTRYVILMANLGQNTAMLNSEIEPPEVHNYKFFVS